MGRRSKGSWVALGVAAAVVVAMGSPVGAQATPRSGNPPTLSSATIDAERRLVVTYSAPDGVTYGGTVYLDNNPLNANVPPPNKYGSFMHCNNKSTCLGRWALPATSATGPFTFTTPVLDATRFPAGTYWVQVETTNEDPYPSTRQWEDSNVLSVVLGAAPSPGSASPTTPTLPKVPPAGQTAGDAGGLAAGIPTTKDCTALKAYYGKLADFKAIANGKKAGYSAGTRQKAANAAASIEACQRADKDKAAPTLPAGAKAAQDAAAKARTAADEAKRDADQARQRANDLLRQANAAAAAKAPNAAALRRAADQAKRVADAKAKLATAKKMTASSATAKCRRFQSTVDKRITYKCR